MNNLSLMMHVVVKLENSVGVAGAVIVRMMSWN